MFVIQKCHCQFIPLNTLLVDRLFMPVSQYWTRSVGLLNHKNFAFFSDTKITYDNVI